MSSNMHFVRRTALLALASLWAGPLEPSRNATAAQAATGVAVLQVDTDRHLGAIDRKIYGQFLEHINHSVVDGLFGEQIRGQGFEGEDFKTYWEPFSKGGSSTARNIQLLCEVCNRAKSDGIG